MSVVKTLLVLSLFTLMVIPANAQDRVGLYGDLEASQTELVTPPLAFTEAYLIAHVPSYPEGIIAVEFGTNQWLPLPDSSEGNLSITWHGRGYYLSPPEVVIVTFTAPALPDENGNVLLATIQFYPHHAGWPPEHYVIETIGATWDWGTDLSPQVVKIDGTEEYIDGDLFILNPSIVATDANTLSRIKLLY